MSHTGQQHMVVGRRILSEIDREAAATLGALRVAFLLNGQPPKPKQDRRNTKKKPRHHKTLNSTSLVISEAVKFLHLPRDVEAAVLSSKKVLQDCVSECREHCLIRLQIRALAKLVDSPPTSHGFKLTSRQLLEDDKSDNSRSLRGWNASVTQPSPSRTLEDILLDNVDLVPKLVAQVERPVFWKLPATALLSYFHVRDVLKNAALGNARAQCTLAVMHEEGRAGLAKDRQIAAKHFARAAAHGDAYAQYGLALLFESAESESFQKDEERALQLYIEAAQQGLPEAQWKLGIFYEEGRAGLLKCDFKAVEWYRAAAERGCASAQFSLGTSFEVGRGGLPKSEHDALMWYRAAAVQNLPTALCYLGLAHEHGKAGLRRSDRKAAKLYKRAADRGCAPAALCLGLFYAKGRGGLAKDPRRANELFRIAAVNGAQLPLPSEQEGSEIPRNEEYHSSCGEQPSSSIASSNTTTDVPPQHLVDSLMMKTEPPGYLSSAPAGSWSSGTTSLCTT